MIDVFKYLILVFLVFCAVFVARAKNMLSAVIIFAAYSLMMAILWLLLAAPDIAITEAAIGAGVTTLLLLAAISKTRREE
ncbi:MAG: hydrogenase subunit MbhD domain-containing protein [Dethiobacter sp.]